MAKNPDNDGNPILKPIDSIESKDRTSLQVSSIEDLTIDTEEETTEDEIEISTAHKLTSRQKYLALSFLIIIAINIGSFLLPDSVYRNNPYFALLLSNVELLTIFGRDIYLYIKRMCWPLKISIISLSSLYLWNIVNLLIDIPHDIYTSIGMLGIALASIIVYYINSLKN